MTENKLATFRYEVGPLGHGVLIVNGQDITDRMSGLEIQARPGQPTLLTIHMMAASGGIKGEGIVQVTEPGGYNAAEMVRFLEAIDPGLLEAEALERSDMTVSPVVAMLDVLKEWISGHPTKD